MRISTYRQDTTEALFASSGTASPDFTVPPDFTVSTGATLLDVFQDLVDGRADVAEFGLTFLLRALDAGTDLVALPVFPTRVFRHSCVFVNTASGIRGPEDLVGRTIGEFGVYGQDSGVWAKGVLMDEYGFRPERNRWVIGGLDTPSPPFGFTTHPVPAGLDVGPAPAGRALGDLLRTGEIDALFTANVPQVVLDGAPEITRLFGDYEARERDWYRRTGIFPMMHVLAARREVLDGRPGTARAVLDAFSAAKEAGAETYRRRRRLFQAPTMLPWANALDEANTRLLGDDWWPYGIERNRHALDTYLRYHHEQGLSARRRTIEELFADEVLAT